ncbi:uracil phosphoribosyltransferase-domain-containing protein [Triangularia verruculosa]|uniref:Uracil phosphoribosyltransferase-domain-containing protein n=1 Tax=Triangularia verruculosa TaxID=2587418 RepID=A0AAN6XEL5_9PEZI|nr:uracil phosphoribosyltransferase-domain-containing protein [Triangularia verruculosa]
MTSSDSNPNSSLPGSSNPVVIGVYGIPGCGKSSLLRELSDRLGEEQFNFLEGSQVIASLLPGGLAAFHQASNDEKAHYRELAIKRIADDAMKQQKVAVVAGHFMFWSQKEQRYHRVCTNADLSTYTHIVYLDIAAETIAERRQNDKTRERSGLAFDRLDDWANTEKRELQRLCRSRGILFIALSDAERDILSARMIKLLLDFKHHCPKQNRLLAQNRLDWIIQASGLNPDSDHPGTMLVMDADKTLATQDAGHLFWDVVIKNGLIDSRLLEGKTEDLLTTLFSSQLGYSYCAFRQATLLYEQHCDDGVFDEICRKVASMVKMHPEMLSLLQAVERKGRVSAVVVTCGLRRVWEMVLANHGLMGTVQVIGGGRITDGFVVTAEVKASLVERLQDAFGFHVWAFGDSPLDIPMLRAADEAIVVAGEQHARSRSMDKHLLEAIESGEFRPRQVLLPSEAAPRLDPTKLPLVEIDGPGFLLEVSRRRDNRHAPMSSQLRLIHATDRNAARLLTTPTRDARVAGPSLREAHRLVGRYLATELLSGLVGTEEYEIPHVQGHCTQGHRVKNERETIIVPLMRGGEPMAFGVSDVLPLALFVHAKNPSDLEARHLSAIRMVLLVDSVVNTGKSIVEFVQHIRKLSAAIRIVVMAGVVQAKAVAAGPDGILYRVLQNDSRVDVVALRLSDNKFTGKGATDTGARLFNTTEVE